MGKKYDVVISYAEEDKAVVQQITPYLKRYKLEYFDFHEELNWGKSLIAVTLDKYGKEAECVLVVISEHYTKKYWTITEFEIAQLAGKYKDLYVLPLRLDDAPMERMSSSIIHLKWNNNPSEIAISIVEILRPVKRKRKRMIAVKVCISLSISMLLCAIFFFHDNNSDNEIKNKIHALTKDHDSDFVAIKAAIDTSLYSIKEPSNGKSLNSYTITGAVKDASGLPLDSVKVTVLGEQCLTRNGQFKFVFPNMVDVNKGFPKEIVYNYEKEGYEPRILKENVFISKDDTEHTTEATLTKQN